MYYQKIAFAIAAFGVAASVVNAAHTDWKSEAREPVQHVFMNSQDTTLDVDDIDGTIEVIGDTGNTIRVEGEKIIHAADSREIERAKKEVTLDINERDGVAQLYVNGPFRNNHSSDDHGFHVHWDENQYQVTYNLTIHAPRSTELRLRNVNGEIKTGTTNGKFDLRGVNGALTMTGAAGYGHANVVNGRLSVAFRENPKEPSEFRSVNGAIEASFPAGLSADLRLKTLNGQAYTDFDTTSATATAAAGEKRNGRFVYRPDRSTSVKIGSGGPTLSFETVNGDIRIRKGTN